MTPLRPKIPQIWGIYFDITISYRGPTPNARPLTPGINEDAFTDAKVSGEPGGLDAAALALGNRSRAARTGNDDRSELRCFT